MKSITFYYLKLSSLSVLFFPMLLLAQDKVDKPEVYYPATREEIAAGGDSDVGGIRLPEPSITTLISQVFVFLVVLAGGAFLLRNYARRGKLTLKPNKSDQGLLVSETKPLGNKQFLVVVEYGPQKILLGVGPGMINHLCYLNNPYDASAVSAYEEEEQTQVVEKPKSRNEDMPLPPMPPNWKDS